MKLNWKILTPVCLALVFTQPSQAQQPVSIQFAAQVGSQVFNCEQRYQFGNSPVEVSVSDFRLYVHDLSLIGDNGAEVPVALDQDGIWQFQNIALLDFENRQGACRNGNPPIRDVVTGSAPKGNYRGIRFKLGLPFKLNHENATIAPSPLNLTALFWSWQGGYKFLRVDLHNHYPAGSQQTGVNGFPLHLGSTGCKSHAMNERPSNCKNPNRVDIVFDNFDPQQQKIIVDLAQLVAGINLQRDEDGSKAGCIAMPGDKDCVAFMRNLGLPYGDSPTGQQQVFRTE